MEVKTPRAVRRDTMKKFDKAFELSYIEQIDNWGEWNPDVEIGDMLYGTTYYWMHQDPLASMMFQTDPSWVISKLISLGYKLFDPRAYRWVVSILLETKYNTTNGSMTYPSIKDVKERHDQLDFHHTLYIYDENRKVDIPVVMLQNHIPEQGTFKIVDLFMRLFVYSDFGAYYVNGRLKDNDVRYHINRMRNAFKHDSYTLTYMTWAYALCMRYNGLGEFGDDQFPNEDEVLERYHHLLNTNTNKLKSTRAFQYIPLGGRDFITYYAMH